MNPVGPISVILNVRSGAARARADEAHLRRAFAAADLQPDIRPVSNAVEIEKAVAYGIAQKSPVIAAAGGDGTIGSVAARLAGTGHPFGVIPMGTLNHFARDLGVPLDLEGAVRNLAAGTAVPVDVGGVNGRVFVNNSSLGLYPRLVQEREHMRRRGFRRLTASLWAAFTVMRRLPFVRVRLEIDGIAHEHSTPFVFIGNNAYQLEGFRLGARSCLCGGRLCVCVAHRRGRWGLLALAFRALVGRLHEARDFDVYHPCEVTVESRAPSLAVSLDGEVLRLAPPLHYTIYPRALRVVLPAIPEGCGAP